MDNRPTTARQLVETLELVPHPEGGWYRETHRSAMRVTHPALGERSAFTSILFLLEFPQVSHLHRIDAEELWNWHAGIDLVVHIETSPGVLSPHLLGPSSGNFQLVVPPGRWFASELAEPNPGSWCLVGCTVAPGFEFTGFELGSRPAMGHLFPSQLDLVARLTGS